LTGPENHPESILAERLFKEKAAFTTGSADEHSRHRVLHLATSFCRLDSFGHIYTVTDIFERLQFDIPHLSYYYTTN